MTTFETFEKYIGNEVESVDGDTLRIEHLTQKGSKIFAMCRDAAGFACVALIDMAQEFNLFTKVNTISVPEARRKMSEYGPNIATPLLAVDVAFEDFANRFVTYGKNSTIAVALLNEKIVTGVTQKMIDTLEKNHIPVTTKISKHDKSILRVIWNILRRIAK